VTILYCSDMPHTNCKGKKDAFRLGRAFTALFLTQRKKYKVSTFLLIASINMDLFLYCFIGDNAFWCYVDINF
jgi:hypothetical protein